MKHPAPNHAAADTLMAIFGMKRVKRLKPEKPIALADEMRVASIPGIPKAQMKFYASQMWFPVRRKMVGKMPREFPNLEFRRK
jgi:hypothetical protein